MLLRYICICKRKICIHTRNGYWTQELEREIFEDDIKNNIDELKAELLRHEKKQHAVNAQLLALLQPERKN